MSERVLSREAEEFKVYLRQLTALELQSVYDRERAADRRSHARYAEQVAAERDVPLRRTKPAQLRMQHQRIRARA